MSLSRGCTTLNFWCMSYERPFGHCDWISGSTSIIDENYSFSKVVELTSLCLKGLRTLFVNCSDVNFNWYTVYFFQIDIFFIMLSDLLLLTWGIVKVVHSHQTRLVVKDGLSFYRTEVFHRFFLSICLSPLPPPLNHCVTRTKNVMTGKK